jgi:chromosome segregation ATPase
LALRDQLYAIQTKFRHLQDSKMLQDNDFKTRHDSNLVTLQGLKKECDDARHHLNEKSRANNDCQSEIAALREQISRREAEIFAGQRDTQQKADHAYTIRKDIDALSFELQKLKEERQRDQIEADRLRELAAIKERENADAEQRLKQTDYDLFKMQERAAELHKAAELREADLRRTSEGYETAHLDLLKCRDEQARLHDEQQNFSRALDMKLAEKNDLARRSDQELGRNRNLANNMHDFDAKTHQTEETLAVTRRELDDLRFAN